MRQESETNLLMIDDDEGDAKLVRHMIGKMPDSSWQFHWAGTYDQGLKKLSEFQWAICLVDYQLGTHTGVEVVAESRARGVNCPFLLLTGTGSRAIDLQAMRAGVKGYLEKGRLCPLELERAIRYAIGTPQAHPPSSSLAISHIPAEAEKLLRVGYTFKQPFVVTVLLIDRESAFRNHLSSGYLDSINAKLETAVRAQISSSEVLFRTGEDAFLVISSKRDTREARQFLSVLLSEPMALSNGDRSRTVSLPAITRNNVFSSTGYPGAGALIADLEDFIAP